jgi:hypothetical protein
MRQVFILAHTLGAPAINIVKQHSLASSPDETLASSKYTHFKQDFANFINAGL